MSLVPRASHEKSKPAVCPCDVKRAYMLFGLGHTPTLTHVTLGVTMCKCGCVHASLRNRARISWTWELALREKTWPLVSLFPDRSNC